MHALTIQQFCSQTKYLISRSFRRLTEASKLRKTFHHLSKMIPDAPLSIDIYERCLDCADVIELGLSCAGKPGRIEPGMGKFTREVYQSKSLLASGSMS